MSYVIKVLGLATGARTPASGLYLASFDPDGYDGRGEVHFTASKAAARPFASMPEAFAFHQTQSRVCPKRPDGQPNRPLTAYTIEIETF